MNTVHVKHLREDPNTGRSRWKVPAQYAGLFWDFLDGDYSKVRAFRAHKDGGFGFSTGCGYAIFDADLLGGNGDGKAERRFTEKTGYQVVGR